MPAVMVRSGWLVGWLPIILLADTQSFSSVTPSSHFFSGFRREEDEEEAVASLLLQLFVHFSNVSFTSASSQPCNVSRSRVLYLFFFPSSDFPLSSGFFK
jgi:hypothetical protein